MLINNKIAHTTVNGPGDRVGVWVQSCTLGCKGCWNPETHDPDSSKYVTTDSVIEWVIENAIDGVTFSGGEPMQQAIELFDVIDDIKYQRPDLSIGMYTGYTLKELENQKYQILKKPSKWDTGTWGIPPEWLWNSIKRHLDFAVMGRFNQHQVDTSRPLLSSKNQQLHLFSNKYKLSDFESQEIEFTIKDGLVQITGFPVGMSDLINLSRNW